MAVRSGGGMVGRFAPRGVYIGEYGSQRVPDAGRHGSPEAWKLGGGDIEMSAAAGQSGFVALITTSEASRSLSLASRLLSFGPTTSVCAL